ncbi:reduced folate transporter isoform X2 [Equus asinus]|uniref:reduced folate transporter isoform X2 n=1 Tax=Equus asinus TaxID=9793 RepID=UPI0038F7A991
MAPSSQAAEKQAPPEPGPGRELKSWRCLVFYLCFYGFMAQMRPGESFITPYLLGPDKNFTRQQLSGGKRVFSVPHWLAVEVRAQPGTGSAPVGLLLALFLKRPKRSLFFNRSSPVGSGATPSELDRMSPGPGRPAGRKAGWMLLDTLRRLTLVRMLWELRDNLRLPQLRLWSLWWVFNSAGYYLIVYYVHILWNVVNPTNDTTEVYNGGVDAASTLLGAITSFAAGFVTIRWALWAELVIAGVTAVQAGLIFLMYSTRSIWLCYVAFVLFRGSYQFLVPIATFQIASSLSKELCALVFGVNTFLATILKTTVTLVVSDRRGLGLPVHTQFLVYFVYFLVMSAAYFLGAVLVGLRHLHERRHQPLPLAQELSSPEEKATQVLSVQDRALLPDPEISTWATGLASMEQSQQPEAKA